MRKRCQVSRSESQPLKATPRANALNAKCAAESCQQIQSSLTLSNDEATRINLHVGIGESGRNVQTNRDVQLCLDFSLTGNLEALASQVVDIVGPYLCKAIADSKLNMSPQQVIAGGTPATDGRNVAREVVLSPGARSLLRTIADIADRSGLQGQPDEAWISLSSWFLMTPGVERHRADRQLLITELATAGFVEVFDTTKRKRYKATVVGRRYLKSLNRG